MSQPVKRVHFRLSLGLKASLAVISLIFVISAFFTGFFILYLKNSSMEELQRRSFALAGSLAYNSRFALYSKDLNTLHNLVNGLKMEKDVVRAMLVDLDGKVIISSVEGDTLLSIAVDSTASADGMWWYFSGMRNIFRSRVIITIEREADREGDAFLFTPLDLPAAGRAAAVRQEALGYAVLDVSLASMDRKISAAVVKAVAITLVMILVVIAGVIIVVRRIVLPVYLLADATREVASGGFGRTVSVKRSDELGVLADSFNEMSLQLKKSKDDIERLHTELESKVVESTDELMARYRELENTFDELKSFDEAKDDFLSMVSHELRTPLNSIQMFSEMLLHGLGRGEKKQADTLTTIINNCQRLSRLINDILDLSKIEAGRLQISLQKVELVGLIKDTLSSLKPNLEKRQLIYSCECSRIYILLQSDPDRVVQVLTNVLSNAIKFSQAGSKIEVKVSTIGEEAVVSVRDRGKGIYEEEIPKVFDKFYQLEKISVTTEGSGLGMSIAKLIIEQLGGRIWIESRINEGTTVYFSLPGLIER